VRHFHVRTQRLEHGDRVLTWPRVVVRDGDRWRVYAGVTEASLGRLARVARCLALVCEPYANGYTIHELGMRAYMAHSSIESV